MFILSDGEPALDYATCCGPPAARATLAKVAASRRAGEISLASATALAFRRSCRIDNGMISLKYGLNPHQQNAFIEFPDPSPIKILNGAPGYINMLDALTSWQLVRELKEATGKASAASYKHVSPAGAAIARPIDEAFMESQFLTTTEFSPVASAYVRARGGDRLCSFGDVLAVSDVVDVSLAQFLKTEVSDLIIAPGFEPEAKKILAAKKKG